MSAPLPSAASRTEAGARRAGIKYRILAVVAGALLLATGLHALVAWYFTDRQNTDAAFAVLGRDLLAWEKDLEDSTAQLRQRALTAVADDVLVHELVELAMLELNAARLPPGEARASTTRTIGYLKSVSLSRLDAALRTGGFSAIAVRGRDRLSHFVSSSGGGMAVPGPRRIVWLSTAADDRGNLPIDDWPAWDETPSPDAEWPGAAVRPTLSLEFPAPDRTVIQMAVPLAGRIDDILVDWSNRVRSGFISGVHVAGAADRPPDPAESIFAVVIFRNVIDRASLSRVEARTGKWPALFSADGRHRQQLVDLGLPDDLLARVRENRSGAGSYESIVPTSRGSSYVALRAWSFDGTPRVILALAASRAATLHAAGETVTAILLASSAILALSLAAGTVALGRFLDPLVALTAAVKARAPAPPPGDAASAAPPAPDPLRPIEIRSRDEVGELAAAFNTLLGELRRSFETLEHRVQVRTGELRQQTRYLRTLIDVLPMGVWLKDTAGRYLAANQAAAAGATRSVDGMAGASDFDLWPRELAERHRAEDEAVMAAREHRTVESPGGAGWIETYRAPVVDEDGSVLGTVGIARDITERKAAESARELALAEATRLARTRSEFLARMSHELRTPLNGILGYTQILQRDPAIDDRQAARLAVVHQSGQHLLTLINELLDFAKIDAGRLELVPHPVALDSLLGGIAGLIRVKAEQKGIGFRVEAPPDLPRAIETDEKRLREVLLNLLDNAVRFTDEGEVVLAVQPAGSSSLRFEVRDTGTGIPDDRLEAIFEPFEQAGDPARRAGGTGLGLAIAREIVRLMGSEIRVRSRVGEGSAFWFDLELGADVEAPEAAAPHQRITGYDGPRRRVLVVDDDAANRALLVDLLGGCGFDVREAHDGREALAAIDAEAPDLVVLDVLMPRMGGHEVIRRVRETPGHRDLRIVAVSASVSPGDADTTLAAGADAFVPKPLDLDRFLSAVARLLDLEWRSAPPAPPAPAAPADDVVAPPLEDLEDLHRLARLGDMRAIDGWAEALARRQPRCAAFAAHLRDLAARYQSLGIVAFVERYRNR